MVHQIAADLIRAVGEVARHQQEARGAHAVAGDDHHLSRLEVPDAAPAVDVDCP
jgi:hypothetical protein